MIDLVASRYAYLAVFALVAVGLYMVIANDNLVKKVIGINLFQSAILLFFIATAFVDGGDAPIVPPETDPGELVVASPLPHVLVLTAIVVGVSLTAVGLALVVRIYNEYGTFYESSLREVRSRE